MNFDINKHLFLTIYEKDYVPKPVKTGQIVPGRRQQFKDPVCEGFRHYLVLDNENVKPPDEAVDEYLPKFQKQQPKIGQKYFPKSIEKTVIKKYNMLNGLFSEYQTKYCEIEADIKARLEGKQRKVSLPEGHIIPETTYAAYYRDPTGFSDSLKTERIRIPDHLTPGTSIGVPGTEYSDYIGHLGGFIVEENFKKKLSMS